MDDPTRTQTDVSVRLDRGEADRAWVMTIAAHPKAEMLGRRVVLAEDASLVLGRASLSLGEGALDDSLVSRRHAEVSLKRGAVALRDLGSHNGTFVNGGPIPARDLREGDVIGVGRTLLLLGRGPRRLVVPNHPTLVGVSAAVARVLDQAALVARRPSSVLIHGETGVGKELVAREIHRLSERTGPLVAVNCGALSDAVLQSELFGHARGAFSGADRERKGLVASAEGGTLFLDEIGDASPALQVSLLRLLEQREYRPVGSDKVIASDARVVAATHVDLSEAASRGAFRPDLFGRLSRFVIEVPALRDRPEDIVVLARLFADRFAGRPMRLSRALSLALLRGAWPSNVRGLSAAIEQAVIAAGDSASLDLTEALAAQIDAPAEIAAAQAEEAERPRAERPEPRELEALVREHAGNIKKLAAALGVGRNTLYRWLREAGLDLASLRDQEDA